MNSRMIYIYLLTPRDLYLLLNILRPGNNNVSIVPFSWAQHLPNEKKLGFKAIWGSEVLTQRAGSEEGENDKTAR